MGRVHVLLLVCLLALASTHAIAADVAVFSSQESYATAVAARMSSLGFTAVAWSNSYQVTPEALADVDVLMVLTGSAFLLEYQADFIEVFVREGGGLVVEQPNFGDNVAIMPPGLEISISNRLYTDMSIALTPEAATHPLTAGLSPADVSGNMDEVYRQDISPAYAILAVGASNPELVALVAASYGSGKVVFCTGNIHPYSLSPGSDEYVSRLVTWTGTPDAPTEMTVEIEVKTKKINLNGNGRVHVIVYSGADFDAETIDPGTVLFADGPADQWSQEDANGDGYLDMVFSFRRNTLSLDASSTEAEFLASTRDGRVVSGVCEISVNAPKGKNK